MTMVRIELRPSEIHGLGCFSKESVEVGQIVWKFQDGFDLVLKPEFVETLPLGARENLLNYAFVSKATGDFVLCSDDSRFTNHSADPNVVCFVPQGSMGNELECYAVRPIEAGEEITNNYGDFDAETEDGDLA